MSLFGYWDKAKKAIKDKLGISSPQAEGKDGTGTGAGGSGRINYGYGELNPIQSEDVFESYDPQTTSGVDTLKNVTENQFKPNTLASPGGFKGICLRVDFLTQDNAPGSWMANVFGTGGSPEILLSVKVRIPEIHSCLPEPFALKGGVTEIDQKVVDMHPTFIAQDVNLSEDPPSPGDIVNVDFGNRVNMSDPIFLGKVLSSPIMFDVAQSGKGAFSGSPPLLQTGTSGRAAALSDLPPSAKPPVPYNKIPYKEKLESLDPRLAPKVVDIISALEARGFRPVLYAAHRTLYEQQELRRKGFSKVSFSFHNAYKNGKKNAYAADILDKAFMGEYGGKWAKLKSPKRKPFWNALGEEAKKRGLVWGGDWGFYDPAHVQLLQNSQLAMAKRETGTGMA